jgi:hypothetical protein
MHSEPSDFISCQRCNARLGRPPKTILGECHKINKAIIQYLREHRVPNGKPPTPEKKQYLEDLGRSLQLVNTQLAALAKDVDLK